MLIVGESSFSGTTIGTNNGRVMYMCTVRTQYAFIIQLQASFSCSLLASHDHMFGMAMNTNLNSNPYLWTRRTTSREQSAHLISSEDIC